MKKKFKQFSEYMGSHLNASIAIVGCVVILLTVIFRFCSNPDSNASNKKDNQQDLNINIAVIISKEETVADQIYNSMASSLKDYTEDNQININLSRFSCNDDDELLEADMKFIADADYEAVVVIGERASVKAKEAITDKPIVFACISDPEQLGLVESSAKPGGNMTGVSDLTPCFEQIALITDISADCKSIGVVFTETDENAVVQLNLVKYQASEMNIEVNEYPVSDYAHIDDILAKTVSDNNDAVYLPEDTELYNNINVVAEYFLNNKMITIAATKNMVDSGCLITCIPDYSDTGVKVALLLSDILFNGEAPTDIPVIYSSETNLYVNTKTAESLGVIIPDDL